MFTTEERMGSANQKTFRRMIRILIVITLILYYGQRTNGQTHGHRTLGPTSIHVISFCFVRDYYCCYKFLRYFVARFGWRFSFIFSGCLESFQKSSSLSLWAKVIHQSNNIMLNFLFLFIIFIFFDMKQCILIDDWAINEHDWTIIISIGKRQNYGIECTRVHFDRVDHLLAASASLNRDSDIWTFRWMKYILHTNPTNYHNDLFLVFVNFFVKMDNRDI